MRCFGPTPTQGVFRGDFQYSFPGVVRLCAGYDVCELWVSCKLLSVKLCILCGLVHTCVVLLLSLLVLCGLVLMNIVCGLVLMVVLCSFVHTCVIFLV